MRRFILLSAIALLAVVAAAATATARPTGVPYKATVFDPTFRLELPEGWVVMERAPDAAQFYRGCASCVHEGEENGEITLDMTLAKLTPAKAIALLRRAPGIRATPVHTVTYRRLRGWGFRGRRTGGMIEFPRSGYRSDPTGAPIDVSVIRAAGKTVTIFVDPHERPRTKAPVFMQDAAAILRTLRFTG
jgi:hypothetical protein